ncbi:pyrroline-5-carboxylate reductase [Vulgatibacter sp.]|uniref:pyrroline-5-carboxylate reductase n=1 Tax=Vulgatibacter sp. TaxID=1971226 RepID=UPI0035671895
MADSPKIAFVGAGNMAEALIKGLLGAGWQADAIVGTGRRPERLDHLHRSYGIRTSLDNVAAVSDAEIVVLAVKPQALERMLELVAPGIDHGKLVISVAAGVPIAALERKLGAGARIVRAMPNTPALVGAGATAVSGGEHATEADLATAKALFDAVGQTVIVDESLLDAVTGLSGSGPAYIFLIIEALSDAGVKVGLPRYTAQALAAQTVLGSAKLLLETGQHPGMLKDQVTSPGGTAIAGLHTLEAGGLRTTLINAVEAATRRAKELGEQFLDD